MFDLDSYLSPFGSHKISDKIKTHGEWWLSSNPGQRFGGHLTWDESTGITLYTGGTIVSAWHFPPPDSLTIQGIAGGDRPVTLLWPLSCRGGVKPGGQEIEAWGAVIGGHVENVEEKYIESLMVQNDCLCEWLGGPPITEKHVDPEADNPTVFSTTYSVDLGAIDFGRISTLDADCHITSNYSHGGHGAKITLTLERGLQLAFTNPISVNEAIAISRRIELFITLVTGMPSLTTALQINPANAHHDRQSLLIRRPPKPHKRSHARQLMPAPLEKIKNDIPAILSAWFSLFENFSPVLNLLSATLYRAETNPDNDFLAIAQAVEGYCRIRWKDIHVDEAMYAELLPKLLEVIDPQAMPTLRNKAKASLKYMNDFSLRDRLKKLFEREAWLTYFVDHKEGNAKLVSQFISQVVDSRNSLTHVDIAKPIRINYQTVYTLRAVLCASLLGLIGIPSQTYEDLLRKGSHDCWW